MKNKLVLFLHKFIKNLKIENFVLILAKFFKIPEWKALPQNVNYDSKDKILIKRNGVIFNLNRNDFTQWQIYANYPELHFEAFKKKKTF